MPWRADGELFLPGLRVTQLTRVLDWLHRGHRHGSVEGGAWLVPQFLTDGHLWRGVVWNAGADEVDSLQVALPAGMPPPSAAVHVDARGRRHALRPSSDFLVPLWPLRQWEFVVLA